MQVSVKTMPMSAVPDDMNRIKRKINVCLLELEQVKRDLGSLTGLEQQVMRIKRCEREMEAQARYCTLFGNAISQICRQYVCTEHNVMDYSENVRIKARRESLSNRSLKELYPLFCEVFFREGGRLSWP